jgi:hypothetical protein
MNFDETDILLVEDSGTTPSWPSMLCAANTWQTISSSPEMERKLWTFYFAAAPILHVPSNAHPGWSCSI